MSIEKRLNIIAEVIFAAENGLLVPSFHAEEQLTKRNMQLSDVEEMLYRAQREEHKEKNTKTAFHMMEKGGSMHFAD